MAKENHAAIVVPGLKDRVSRHEFLTRNWPDLGIAPVIHPVYWHDAEKFEFKLERLAERIRFMKTKYELVSLVGTSAGGSAVVLAGMEEDVHKIVTVCSRLSVGPVEGYWQGFAARTASSPAFGQALRLLDKRSASLTPAQLAKMLCVYAGWGDELVPGKTAVKKGAQELRLSMGEHAISIAAAMLSGKVTDFLLAT